MSVEQSVECVAGETVVLREDLPQCCFPHHKSHMIWPGLEPGPPQWEPATNHLSYGMALQRNVYKVLTLNFHMSEQTIVKAVLCVDCESLHSQFLSEVLGCEGW
jgi:hypothetical protein